MARQPQTLKVRKLSTGDRVYREIRRMLVERDIPPGQRIDKPELCATLGVSLTPVNEALKRLVGEELVQSRGKDGFFSRKYSLQDLVDLHEARAAIEGMAIRLCIEKLTQAELEQLTHYYEPFRFPLGPGDVQRYQEADRAFHEQLVVQSGNAAFVKFIETFNLMASSYQMGLSRPPDETIDEHRKIVEALRGRKAELAHRLMLEHHLRSRDALKEKIRRGAIIHA